MMDSSTIRNGRCDFYEPYGATNSWRVLDADNNVIPTAGETYHVAVWLQADVSGKFGIAVGTWVENFWMPFQCALTPYTHTCYERRMYAACPSGNLFPTALTSGHLP